MARLTVKSINEMLVGTEYSVEPFTGKAGWYCLVDATGERKLAAKGLSATYEQMLEYLEGLATELPVVETTATATLIPGWDILEPINRLAEYPEVPEVICTAEDLVELSQVLARMEELEAMSLPVEAKAQADKTAMVAKATAVLVVTVLSFLQATLEILTEKAVNHSYGLSHKLVKLLADSSALVLQEALKVVTCLSYFCYGFFRGLATVA